MRKAGFALSTALLTGCISPVALKYEPRAAATAIEGDRLPSVFLAAAEDKTGGVHFFGPNPGTTQGSLSDALREALTREFQRIGMPLTAGRKNADAVLYASMAEASATWSAGFRVPVKGYVRIGLAFKNQDRAVLWDGELVGDGHAIAGGGGAVGNAANLAVNEAFSDAISKLGPLIESEGLVRVLVAGLRPAAKAAPVEPKAEDAAPPVSDVDELPASRGERAKAYAVVIGVERYREGLPKAMFASGDARLVAEYYKRALGVPEENLALLVNDRATKSDFEKYFERWLPNRVEPGAEVYVYYSGHGAPNPKTGDAFLVPYDADPTYIDQTGYPLKKVYEQLAKLPAKSIVVTMDSCFSGAGGRSVIAKGARPLVSVQNADIPRPITVIAASAGDQISNSYEGKGHGLFTYFLLKGIKEKGADLRAVFEYLKPEVSKVARREYNADQDPQWREGR